MPAVATARAAMTIRRILVTGASGFVGRALVGALAEAGFDVRCASRNPQQARQRQPGYEWVRVDLAEPASIKAAMTSCEAAFYLVHSMSDGSADYAQREREAARAFSDAAAAAGIQRVVYLGGIRPVGRPSKHLASRLAVGQILRHGIVPTIELRAAMIVGHGSESWRICRDLAANLPGMVLPRWTRTRSEPVAIDDVVVALRRALDLPLTASTDFDIPGPEALTVRQMLVKTARALGLPDPRMIDVPVLTPRLSSYWLRIVTRADWSIARELVLGLEQDLLARDDRYWTLIGHSTRLSFEDAARRALEAEGPTPPEDLLGLVEHIRRGSGRTSVGRGQRE